MVTVKKEPLAMRRIRSEIVAMQHQVLVLNPDMCEKRAALIIRIRDHERGLEILTARIGG